MKTYFQEICIIFLLTALGAAFSLVRGLAPLPGADAEMEPGAIRLLDAEVLEPIWVDARSRVEYAAGHHPGAIWLSHEDWDAGIVDLMSRWLEAPRPIVIYCGSVDCGISKEVAERLRRELEGAEIYTLHGGWEAWDPSI